MSESHNTANVDNEVVVIDDDGDLILRTPRKDFKVCSSALRRASPTFKAMLFGPWKEAKPATGPWCVDLPDDSPEALEILLPVIHGKTYTDRDLKEIEVRHMAHVISTGEKYLMESIRPWTSQWVDACNKFGWCNELDVRFGKEYLENLDSAWELGRQDAVVWFLAHLLHNGKAADLEKLADEGFFKSKPHLTQSLRCQRRLLVEQYLQEYYQEYSKPCQFRGSNDLVADIAQRQACKEAKIAAMKAGFRSHIWIFPSSWKAFSHSPKELQRAVEAAFWWFTPSPGHEGCKPKELQIFPSPETIVAGH
ncbi:hypothetical protein VTJ04DRAFT_5398 [Mycothermus thermophilus]|uniref:uncharacterized protein n=1 Tax=Humicola insolens TaxID=85995 RepID=UPI003742499F